MSKFLIILITLFLLPKGIDTAEAKQYPIFDGQVYNGLYYPRIDIIEWTHKGQAPHLEFHIYNKDEPIEIEAKTVMRGGNRILLVNYYFTKRQEKVCRSVVEPSSFGPDQPLYFYKDSSDAEYNNIYVAISPKPATKNMATYAKREYSVEGCDEADAKQVMSGQDSPPTINQTNASAETQSGQRAPATLVDKKESPTALKPAATKAEKKHELIDYENNALPYNF
jgi:hypothetical protein